MPETINQKSISFKMANAFQNFEDARKLFEQYANSLDLDLSFQDFANELKRIDEQYGKPKGALLLAYNNEIAIGCVGIRELDKDTAELKRMFVQPGYRGCKIGQTLLEMMIAVAKDLSYKNILLDTLPGMRQAIRLYRSFGFSEIPPYRFNPVEGAVFMELKL